MCGKGPPSQGSAEPEPLLLGQIHKEVLGPIRLRVESLKGLLGLLETEADKQKLLELMSWEQLLVQCRQDVARSQQEADRHLQALRQLEAATEEKIKAMDREAVQLKQELNRQKEDWGQQKQALEAQSDGLVGLVKQRDAVMVGNSALTEDLKCSKAMAVQQQARANTAEAQAATLQKHVDLLTDKANNSTTHRDALLFQVRDLDVALNEARAQCEMLRQQLAARQQPAEQLIADVKRLQADNQRLVALLGSSKEWQRLAADMAVEGGVHYVPVEEALMHKGLVAGLYPPLRDRMKELCPDVDGEEWAWVPRPAIEATMTAIATAMPNAPVQPFLAMLLQLNKIWRQREGSKLSALKAKHAAEVRKIHELYRQRAPYEAVVGKTRLANLKRQLRLQAEHAQHLQEKAQRGKEEFADDCKITLQLGLESIHTLSSEVRKLSSKNNQLSRALNKKRRQPPVCSNCLDNALLQAQVPLDVAQPWDPSSLLPSTSGDVRHTRPTSTLNTPAPGAVVTGNEMARHRPTIASGPGARLAPVPATKQPTAPLATAPSGSAPSATAPSATAPSGQGSQPRDGGGCSKTTSTNLAQHCSLGSATLLDWMAPARGPAGGSTSQAAAATAVPGAAANRQQQQQHSPAPATTSHTSACTPGAAAASAAWHMPAAAAASLPAAAVMVPESKATAAAAAGPHARTASLTIDYQFPTFKFSVVDVHGHRADGCAVVRFPRHDAGVHA